LVAAGSRKIAYFESEYEITPFQLTQDLIPAEIISKRDNTIQASFHKTRKPVIPAPLASWDKRDYVKSLPTYRRRLLSWCRLRKDMVPSSVVSTIKDAIADNIPLVFGSDGGLNEQGGTFGYVMGLTEVPLWEGAGPVDGDPHTASSTRSELFGYAGSLELLLLLKKVYQLFDTGATVITWMDSSSAMTRLDDLEQSTPNSGQYPDDADILTHIQWLWNGLPGITHTRQWIKAHQDSDSPYADLPWSARLNVMADSLATAYYQNATTRNKPITNSHYFSTCRVSLLVNGKRVTAKYAASIRFHINGTNHRRFLQGTKPGWHSDSVWNYIDFESLGGAFLTLTSTARTNICKLVHGWMNTGHQRVKLNTNADSSCPRCGEASENQDHALRCPAASTQSIRYNALVLLRSSIVTKCGSSISWNVLFDSLAYWLAEGKPQIPEAVEKYKLSLSTATILKSAIQEQSDIG
jgi:hypothetical protein